MAELHDAGGGREIAPAPPPRHDRLPAFAAGGARDDGASHHARAALIRWATSTARRLRREGVPPEVMLVRVKEGIREATPAGTPFTEARTLMEDVVHRSVDAYYLACTRKAAP